MNTQILITKATVVAVLIASQLGVAQTGGPYGGTAPSISNGTIIQFEDFDLGSNNTGGTAPFGYKDSTPGNDVGVGGTSYEPNTTYRANHDVDLATHIQASKTEFNGQITINQNTNGEYQYYTVTVAEAGEYFIRINYGHGSGTPKRFLIEKLDTNLENAVTLVDGTDKDSADYTALPKTANSYTLGTSDAGPVNNGPTKFNLIAGETFVVKFTHKDGGPAYNWFQFVNNPNTLSMDALSAEETLLVYPNPSVDGLFNINIESNWKVYSLLGVKVTEGIGKTVDLSGRAKGAYILKTDNESKMLILK